MLVSNGSECDKSSKYTVQQIYFSLIFPTIKKILINVVSWVFFSSLVLDSLTVKLRVLIIKVMHRYDRKSEKYRGMHIHI